MTEPVRLSKRMSELGLSSRREADEWIAKGWVRVDGKIISELGHAFGQSYGISHGQSDAQCVKQIGLKRNLAARIGERRAIH